MSKVMHDLDAAVIDDDLVGGALMEETDGDCQMSSMTTFDLAVV